MWKVEQTIKGTQLNLVIKENRNRDPLSKITLANVTVKLSAYLEQNTCMSMYKRMLITVEFP